MYKLYMRCKSDICVGINWNDTKMKSKYSYIRIYIYTHTHSPRPQTMDDIYWLWYCLDYWLMWNLVNIMNGWFEMIDCDWNPNRISIWENSPACELDIENRHCQKPRGFKVEWGALLGTVPVFTTLPLCCWKFQ